ncbi:HLA class II histocompatibility antigen, DM alpha chain-like, partial [Camarhynchus parvulus]|uniref:HLA class II histocompatibility antigen, DM alpha chain-like n=1 Tax=Geospiza parvula TaxID=87175 RepID=UPI001237FEAE
MGVLGALLGAVLVAVAVAEPAGSAAPHVVAEVLSCQADAPSLALSVTLDGRGLSWFHFPSSRWIPEAAELRAWPEGLETPAELLAETQLCREILGILGKQLAGLLPRARGTPVVSVFPARPPSPGGATTLVCLVENISRTPVVSVFPARPPSPGGTPVVSVFPACPPSPGGTPVVSVFPARPPSPGGATTLVCLVENIFPPSLTVSWVAGAGVARGVTLGPFVPNPDLTFVRISRISVTPRPGDVVACVVTSGKDNATTVVAYW